MGCLYSCHAFTISVFAYRVSIMVLVPLYSLLSPSSRFAMMSFCENIVAVSVRGFESVHIEDFQVLIATSYVINKQDQVLNCNGHEMQVEHIVVMGHSSCGGIRALMTREDFSGYMIDYPSL